MKLIEEDNMEDPLYSNYRRLHCELTPLDVHSEEFSMFSRTKNRMLLWHGSRLTNWTGILSQGSLGSLMIFLSEFIIAQHMIRFYSLKLKIKMSGLRIAPPEAPVTGYMFGKGVYFADMFSKSANYCCSSTNATAGVLLLCEVALGDMAELVTANYHADKLPPGKLSTKGVGATAPDLSEAETLEDGVVIPLGKSKEHSGHKGSLLYNEYIV